MIEFEPVFSGLGKDLPGVKSSKCERRK